MAVSAAERSALYRERRRNGVVCMVSIPIYARDVDALIALGRITRDQYEDRSAIAEAVENVVDAFTEATLADRE